MIVEEAVGIVGASGDFGSKLAIQVCSGFDTVHSFDYRPLVESAMRGVDPALSANTIPSRPTTLPTLRAILDSCAVIHWCAPTDAVLGIEELPVGTTLVLHDSVMANSLEAARRLEDRTKVRGQIGLAHCLMNSQRRVVVATGLEDTAFVSGHFKKMGLDPMELSADEHDEIMAHSQAPLALVSLALSQLLHEYAEDGLLTTSAGELMRALDARASRWTPETIRAILSNPHLKELIASFSDFLPPEQPDTRAS